MKRKITKLLVLTVLTVLSVALPIVNLNAQTVVYSQTSLAGTTGVTPGLFDELGLLDPNSLRKDFYEIFVNHTSMDILINRAVIFGTVYTASRAVLVPAVISTASSTPNILVPDTDPSHVLATANVPVSTPDSGPDCFTSTSGFTGCPITISFSSGVILPPGGKLAFGFIVPTAQVVEAMLFGTDTLPCEFSSTIPSYYTGFYATNAFGNLVLALGNHYLVIKGEQQAPVDSDLDGQVDSVEIYGLDGNSDGVLDVDIPAMGANPARKDLFVEIDCLVKYANDGSIEHSHCPLEAAVRRVVQAFADAPVVNLDSTTGIQLHVDTGALYGAGVVHQVYGVGGVIGNYGNLSPGDPHGGGEQIPETGNEVVDWNGAVGDPATSLFDLKNAHFNPYRANVFRYSLFIHQTNARSPINDCTSGSAWDNNFIVSLGGTRSTGNPCWGIDGNGYSVGTELQQAGTFLHEFGHTLALYHGGSEEVNLKPHYLSVMNYSFQMCTVPSKPDYGLPGGCDLSRHKLPDLYEKLQPGLDECAGIDGGLLGFGSMDFNGNKVLDGLTCPAPNTTNIQQDINRDYYCVTSGPDFILQATGAADDLQSQYTILDGYNLCCDSAAQGDDVQMKSVGTCQPNPLHGFDDWTNLRYRLWAQGGLGEESSLPVIEADPDEIEKAKQSIMENSDSALTVGVIGPSKALPGAKVAYDVTVANLLANDSRGPALQSNLKGKHPDGSVKSFDLGDVQLESMKTQTRAVEFNVPDNSCPMTLTSVFTVSYRNMAGDLKYSVQSAGVEVQDRVRPTIACNSRPSIRPRDVPVSFRATASDNCDQSPTVKIIAFGCYAQKASGKRVDKSDSCVVAVSGDTIRVIDSGGVGDHIWWTVQAQDGSGNVSEQVCAVDVVKP